MEDKKMVKKLLVIMMLLSLAFFGYACGNKTSESDGKKDHGDAKAAVQDEVKAAVTEDAQDVGTENAQEAVHADNQDSAHADNQDAAPKDPHGAVHWGYMDEIGPAHWGDLSEEYILCKEGQHQSPIDITTSEVMEEELPPLEIAYSDTSLSIVNNGHAIQVNYDAGSTLTIDGNTYELLQFHYHSPSENTVDGKAFPMEAHYVHKNEKGELAVLAVFYEEGDANALMDTLWANVADPHEPKSTSEITLNGKDLLPDDLSYYTWNGSLTTPPCSENVRWFLLRTPPTLSSEQLEAFNAFYDGNARPVQPLNGRVIKVSK